MKNLKIKKSSIYLGVVFLVTIINFVFWGCQKEGYFVDELYTYGLSNSYMVPFMFEEEGYLDSYHTGAEFFEYLTVNDEDAFQFDSVWYNQSQDVHPPLYYSLFHLVSSFCKESISPWIGLAINLVFFLLSIFVFYKISKEVFSDEMRRYLSTAMYALSVGMLYCAVYIRMYMMLVFFVLLFFLLAIRLCKNEAGKKETIIYYLAIAATVFLGFLSHYHFVISAVVIAFCFGLYLLFAKRIRPFLCYAGACVVAGLGTLVVYPYSWEHIFGGYRGKEAMENAKNSAFLWRLKVMFEFVNEQIFGGMFFVIAIILVLVCVISILVAKKKGTLAPTKKISLKDFDFWLRISILFIAVVCFIILSKTAAFINERYLFVVYPFAILSAFIVTEWTISNLSKKSHKWIYIALTVGCVLVSYVVSGGDKYLFNSNAVVPAMIEEQYQGTNAIYVTDASYRHVSDSHSLALHDEVYVADYTVLDRLDQFEDDVVVLYINHDAISTPRIKRVHDLRYYLDLIANSEYTSYTYLGNTDFSRVLVLKK